MSRMGWDGKRWSGVLLSDGFLRVFFLLDEWLPESDMGDCFGTTSVNTFREYYFKFRWTYSDSDSMKWGIALFVRNVLHWLRSLQVPPSVVQLGTLLKTWQGWQSMLLCAIPGQHIYGQAAQWKLPHCYARPLQPHPQVIPAKVDVPCGASRLNWPSFHMGGTTDAFRLHSPGYPSPPDCLVGHVRIAGWVVTNWMCSTVKPVRRIPNICLVDLALLLAEFIGNFLFI